MIKNTKFFRILQRRIKAIEKIFFPVKNLKGNYNPEEKDKIRSYSILAHAELEYYFEEIARYKSLSAFSKFKNNSLYKSTVLMGISSFHSCDCKQKNDLKEIIQESHSYYHNMLRNNHGIKENNIKKILFPLGLLPDDIDPAWVSTLSSFSATRGEFAHTSGSVKKIINPADIKNDLEIILKDLSDLDKKINSLK